MLVAEVVEDYRGQRERFERLPEQIAADPIEDERERALFLTYGIATDYLRPSDEHWQNMASLWESHRRFFDPTYLEEADRVDELSNVLNGYSYFRGNKDAESWATIGQTLAQEYEGDPRRILEENDYDALRALQAVRTGDFPQFGGEKIGPVWIRLMSEEIHGLTNVEKVMFPVDTQTRKVTRFLLNEPLSDQEIRDFWADFCETYDFEPLVIDQALWALGADWEWGQPYLEARMDRHGIQSDSRSTELPRESEFEDPTDWIEAVAMAWEVDRQDLVRVARRITDLTRQSTDETES